MPAAPQPAYSTADVARRHEHPTLDARSSFTADRTTPSSLPWGCLGRSAEAAGFVSSAGSRHGGRGLAQHDRAAHSERAGADDGRHWPFHLGVSRAERLRPDDGLRARLRHLRPRRRPGQRHHQVPLALSGARFLMRPTIATSHQMHRRTALLLMHASGKACWRVCMYTFAVNSPGFDADGCVLLASSY